MAIFTLTQRSLPHRLVRLVGWAIAIGVILYLPYQADQVRIDQYSQVAAIAVAILFPR